MGESIAFVATESGFQDGIGGASNAASAEDYHYVLFGFQSDDQHPEYTGVYFEFDDQIHGSVNGVSNVTTSNDAVEFVLKDRQVIVVKRGMDPVEWSAFLTAIANTFPADLIRKAAAEF
jgi:hypothetical protein